MEQEAAFGRIATLRRELADFAETLSAEQLETPSLCGAWDVRTVIAHLTVAPSVPQWRFGLEAVRQRGSLDRTIDAISRRLARAPITTIVANLRDNADSRATPPLMPAYAPLADLVAHTADIRLPLDLAYEPDPGDVAASLGFLAGAPMGFMPRRRLRGIALIATDLDQSWGSGVELRGSGIDLIMAIVGRRVALERVSGDGVAVLAARV